MAVKTGSIHLGAFKITTSLEHHLHRKKFTGVTEEALIQLEKTL